MTAMQSARGRLQLGVDDPKTLRIEGLDIGRPFPKYSYLRRFRYEYQFGQALAARVERELPDVFIAANTSPSMLAPSVAVCRKRGIPFVFWVQDLYGNASQQLLGPRYMGLGRFIGHYFEYKERRLLAQSQHVVLISEDFTPFAIDAGLRNEQISIIHNWAPIDELPLRAKQNAWSQSNGLDDKFVFLYSGTLGLKHNPEYLAQLCAAFESEPQVVVVVISEGIGADWLAQVKAQRGLKNLHLLPYQAFDAMPDVLASADVLLTLLEASAGVFSVPSKILSYMCAKRPILMAGPPSNLGARTLTQNEAGVVCDADSPARFRELARMLYADPKMCANLGRNARQYAETHFDIKAIANRFENILQKIRKESS
jgi:glycosyltransferase involved in cell wall biosynthesis